MGFSRQEYWSGVPSPSLLSTIGNDNSREITYMEIMKQEAYGRGKQSKAKCLAENCDCVGSRCMGRASGRMTALPLTWELFLLPQK